MLSRVRLQLVTDRQDARLVRPDEHIKVADLQLPPYLQQRRALQHSGDQVVLARRRLVAELLRRQQIQGMIADSSDHAITQFIDLLGRQRRANR